MLLPRECGSHGNTRLFLCLREPGLRPFGIADPGNNQLYQGDMTDEIYWSEFRRVGEVCAWVCEIRARLARAGSDDCHHPGGRWPHGCLRKQCGRHLEDRGKGLQVDHRERQASRWHPRARGGGSGNRLWRPFRRFGAAVLHHPGCQCQHLGQPVLGLLRRADGCLHGHRQHRMAAVRLRPQSD